MVMVPGTLRAPGFNTEPLDNRLKLIGPVLVPEMVKLPATIDEVLLPVVTS